MPFALLVVVAVQVDAGSTSASDTSNDTTAQASTARGTSPASPLLDDCYVLESRHQVFSDFRQVDTVKMNQPFAIGEGDETGLVCVFNPHLSITEKGKVLQLSDTLYNPAVRVRVMKGDSLVQESWAFYYSSAPHFRRSDMLGFRLLDFRVSDRFVKVQGPKPWIPPSPADSTTKSR